MDPTFILSCLFCMTVAAAVQGYGGFGFGIVAISLLTWMPVDLERGSVVVTLMVICNLSVLAWKAQRDGPINWPLAALFCVGGIVGTPLGYAFIALCGDLPIFRLSLGLVLIGFALTGGVTAAKDRQLPRWLALPIGSLGGFLGGAFVTGGPPIVMYCYSLTSDPRKMKATIQVTFVAYAGFRLVSIMLSPRGIDVPIMMSTLCALPVAIPILLLCHRWSRNHEVATFRRVVYTLIGLFGLAITVRAAAQFWSN